MLLLTAALAVPAVDPDAPDPPKDSAGAEAQSDPVLAYLQDQADAIDTLLTIPQGEVGLADVEGVLATEARYIKWNTNGDDVEWFRRIDDHPEFSVAWNVEDCVWGYDSWVSNPDRKPQSEEAIRTDCAEAVESVHAIG